jgi:hypothetical protein
MRSNYFILFFKSYIPQVCHTYWTNNKKIIVIYIQYAKKQTKLHGLSPRANYTDRAAAAGRRG